MSIAGAIFLIAVGAILRYATNIHVQGVSIDTVGLILMIAGAAGLILTFVYEAMVANRARRAAALPDERVSEERREFREPPRP
ncbi:MAG TPA: DUF6458 family protein [Solirubrobacterales bacterium]